MLPIEVEVPSNRRIALRKGDLVLRKVKNPTDGPPWSNWKGLAVIH